MHLKFDLWPNAEEVQQLSYIRSESCSFSTICKRKREGKRGEKSRISEFLCRSLGNAIVQFAANGVIDVQLYPARNNSRLYGGKYGKCPSTSHLLIEGYLFLEEILMRKFHVFDPLLVECVNFGQHGVRKGVSPRPRFQNFSLVDFSFPSQPLKILGFRHSTLQCKNLTFNTRTQAVWELSQRKCVRKFHMQYSANQCYGSVL